MEHISLKANLNLPITFLFLPSQMPAVKARGKMIHHMLDTDRIQSTKLSEVLTP